MPGMSTITLNNQSFLIRNYWVLKFNKRFANFGGASRRRKVNFLSRRNYQRQHFGLFSCCLRSLTSFCIERLFMYVWSGQTTCRRFWSRLVQARQKALKLNKSCPSESARKSLLQSRSILITQLCQSQRRTNIEIVRSQLSLRGYLNVSFAFMFAHRVLTVFDLCSNIWRDMVLFADNILHSEIFVLAPQKVFVFWASKHSTGVGNTSCCRQPSWSACFVFDYTDESSLSWNRTGSIQST